MLILRLVLYVMYIEGQVPEQGLYKVARGYSVDYLFSQRAVNPVRPRTPYFLQMRLV